LLIEVHPNPAEALSDGAQLLDIAGFGDFMGEIAPFAAAAGRTV
jgi:3-deoxy-7-phosphoheptulonate synthase